MLTTTEVIRAHLTEGAAPNGELAGLETKLVSVVESDTLNTVVLSALNFRKQGRLDQSIQLMTRANRTQLDAIEALQGIIDALHGRPKQQVIFSKYRQSLPFEMGIEEADDTLRLIVSMEDETQRKQLHELEAQRIAETERLSFFQQRFRDGSQDATIKEAQTAIGKLGVDLLGAKHDVLNAALSTTQSFMALFSEQAGTAAARYELPRGLYILVTSPTRTRHADDVQTEMGD